MVYIEINYFSNLSSYDYFQLLISFNYNSGSVQSTTGWRYFLCDKELYFHWQKLIEREIFFSLVNNNFQSE